MTFLLLFFSPAVFEIEQHPTHIVYRIKE